METFADWSALPAEIKAHFDTLEDFVGGLDGQEADGGIIDASDAVKAVNGLAAEIARLSADLLRVEGHLESEWAENACLRARPTEEEVAQEMERIDQTNTWDGGSYYEVCARAVLALFPKVQP